MENTIPITITYFYTKAIKLPRKVNTRFFHFSDERVLNFRVVEAKKILTYNEENYYFVNGKFYSTINLDRQRRLSRSYISQEQQDIAEYKILLSDDWKKESVIVNFDWANQHADTSNIVENNLNSLLNGVVFDCLSGEFLQECGEIAFEKLTDFEGESYALRIHFISDGSTFDRLFYSFHELEKLGFNDQNVTFLEVPDYQPRDFNLRYLESEIKSVENDILQQTEKLQAVIARSCRKIDATISDLLVEKDISIVDAMNSSLIKRIERITRYLD